MNLCIIGTGYVGLVTGACLAERGHQVTCVDIDRDKIALLQQGRVPFYEPGLPELVARNMDAGRLHFASAVSKGVRGAQVVFITVGTPPLPDGSADLSYVEAVASQIAKAMDSYKVIVEKSTVPVNTGEWVQRTLRRHNVNGAEFDLVSIPEFLREGSAIADFMNPSRVVIGVESPRAEAILRELFQPFGAPLVITDIKSAELIKHASNCFLAMKISYMNAIAAICEAVAADVTKVSEGMGYDRRIGRDFLDAGVGYGGSCFPKDVNAFIKIAQELGYDFRLLKAVEDINQEQRERLIRKLKEALWLLKGKTIGILGLAFKPNTDDIREAPAIDIIRRLLEEGAVIKAYDPAAGENARGVFGEAITLCSSPQEAAREAHGLVILTEWDEFRSLDLQEIKRLMASPVVIDGRNIYDPKEMARLGFEYRGVGR